MVLNGGTDAGVKTNDIIFFGVCVDNNDPVRAGRIIAVDDVQSKGSNSQQYDPVGITKSTRAEQIANKEFTAWGKDDPNLFIPFLPPHINIIPQEGEAIKLLFYNPNNDTQNKEYIGPLISRPSSLGLENYDTGRMWTTQVGLNIMPPPSTVLNGSYPNPNDIAIQGRHNTDIILGMAERLPSSKEVGVELNEYINEGIETQPEISEHPQILIRAGKFIENKSTPASADSNTKLTFIQLNQFPQTLTVTEEDGAKNVTLLDEKINIIFEYDIRFNTDPLLFTDNNNPDMEFFMGIGLLPNTNTQGQSQKYMASKVDKETNFLFTSPILEANFTLPQDKAIDQINKMLYSFDQNELVDVLKPISGTTGTHNPHYGFSPVNVSALEKKIQVSGLKNHPLYFRMGPNLVEFDRKDDANDIVFSTYSFFGNQAVFDSVKDSIKKFTDSITLAGCAKGAGLAFTSKPDDREITTNSEDTIKKVLKFSEGKEGYVSVGSGNIYLLSNKSEELGRIELENNYGISQFKYVDDIENKTNSLVRGEKLLELLEMLVEFTISHTHAFPGLAPVPTSHGGTTSQEILNKLLKAHNEVLNKNIRIN